MARGQFAIQHPETGSDGSLLPIGARADIVEALECCNTAPDHRGGDVLYGPGFEIHLPPHEDPVRQMTLSITDGDIAWDVMFRIRKQLGWSFTDLETGRRW
jgi:hypothetical protein